MRQCSHVEIEVSCDTDFIHQGLRNTLVLSLQQSHKSQVMWNEPQNAGVITCRTFAGVLHGHIIDDILIPYLRASGFYRAV